MQRKSIEELTLTGSGRHNKARLEARAVKPSAIGPGDPPLHLDIHQQAAWFEIVSRAPHGVLGEHDRISLEMAAVLLCQFRRDPLFPAAKTTALIKLLSRFAMEPTARASLKLPEPKDDSDNPFEEFLRQ